MPIHCTESLHESLQNETTKCCTSNISLIIMRKNNNCCYYCYSNKFSEQTITLLKGFLDKAKTIS